MNSVTPLTASGERRITSSEIPVRAHGTKPEHPTQGAVRVVGRDDQGTRVAPVPEPGQRHGVAALVTVAPLVRLADQIGEVLGVDVLGPRDLDRVALPPRPRDGVPHRTELGGGEGEGPGVDDRLVPEGAHGEAVLGVQPGTVLPGTHHGRRPAIAPGGGDELVDRLLPLLGVADRVSGGERHIGDHPEGDRGLAVRGEDGVPVIARGEVGQGVVVRVVSSRRRTASSESRSVSALRLAPRRNTTIASSRPTAEIRPATTRTQCGALPSARNGATSGVVPAATETAQLNRSRSVSRESGTISSSRKVTTTTAPCRPGTPGRPATRPRHAAGR